MPSGRQGWEIKLNVISTKLIVITVISNCVFMMTSFFKFSRRDAFGTNPNYGLLYNQFFYLNAFAGMDPDEIKSFREATYIEG